MKPKKKCPSATPATGVTPEDLQVAFPKAKLSRIGAEFPTDLTLDEWRGIGSRLHTLSASLAWVMGDWYNAGRRFLPEDAIAFADENQTASAVGRMVGFDAGYIRNAAWVCRQVGVSRRRDTLSFGHHQDVAAMPEVQQERWLSICVEKSWTRADLRAAIGGRDGEAKPLVRLLVKRSIMDAVRWFRVEQEAKPIEQWEPERRAALGRELKPLVEFYEQLTKAGS